MSIETAELRMEDVPVENLLCIVKVMNALRDWKWQMARGKER